MDYLELVTHHCPIEVRQSIAELSHQRDVPVLFRTIRFSKSTPKCTFSTIGQLSKMSSGNTETFRVFFYDLFLHHYDAWKQYDNVAHKAAVRDDILAFIQANLVDVRKRRLLAPMVDVLTKLNADFTEEISTVIDYKSLQVNISGGNWLLNEYASSMGDPEGPKRLEQLLATMNPNELSRTFRIMKSKHKRGDYLLPTSLINQLTRPYIEDNRLTNEVEGDGPPVSYYAKRLLSSL